MKEAREIREMKKDNANEGDHESDCAKPQNRRRTGVPAVPGGEAYRFKKGQSGNPGGRPKKRVLTQALLAVLDQLVPGDARKRTNAQAIAETLVALAMKGHLGAVHELADRTEGRAPIVSIDKSLDESTIEDEVFDSSKADPDQDR